MRAFITITPPGELGHKIDEEIRDVARQFPMVAWDNPEKYHITLAFFKFLTAPELVYVRETLRDLAHDYSPFTLSVGNLAYLHKRHEDSIIFVDVVDQGKTLTALYKQLKLVLDKEKLFIRGRVELQIRIGRLRRTRYTHESKRILADLAKNEINPIGEFEVRALDIYESFYSRDENDTRYQLIESFPLGTHLLISKSMRG